MLARKSKTMGDGGRGKKEIEKQRVGRKKGERNEKKQKDTEKESKERNREKKACKSESSIYAYQSF